MKKLLAGVLAAGLVSSTGGLGGGVAAADDTVYTLGGARPPGVPWHEWSYWSGSNYFPSPDRIVIDYPAGLVGAGVPGSGIDEANVGESVVVGTNNLDRAIRNTSDQTVAIGLSEGALVINDEQARLAHDPAAPSPDQLSFASFGDPAGRHGFGQSLLASMFPPGTFLPFIDYTMPKPVESQYDTVRVVAAYDGIADFPDRPDNLVALVNSALGASLVHTAAAFSSPADVPPQNITTATNSRGGTTTTYLVPDKHLPLTLPLRYVGMPDETVDQIDAVLKPMVDAGYSRNDSGPFAPITVDPVSGLDPQTTLAAQQDDLLSGLDPTMRANVDGVLHQVQSLLPAGIG